jgi:hypothetical protein
MPKTITCRGYALSLDPSGGWLHWSRPDGLIGFDRDDGFVCWFEPTVDGLAPVGSTEPVDAMYEIMDGLVKADSPVGASP